MNVKEGMRSFAHKVGSIFDVQLYNIVISGAKLFMDIAILPGSVAGILFALDKITEEQGKHITAWNFDKAYNLKP